MYQRPAVTQTISYVLRKDENSNAHLLGVNALALDTITPAAKRRSSQSGHHHGHHRHRNSYGQDAENRRHSSSLIPGGILYTGGRDGMIAAWDLHFESPLPRDIPGETEDDPKGLPPPTFRQSFNHHTDWVNDIVLCHSGETLISASSDRTVKLVRPHSHSSTAAHIIGTHGDYVKTLAHASGPGWIASGGLDKTVRLWDINEGRNGQFGSLGNIPETSSKASIYALACNPSGTVLATGSPEKVIRVWDPRSGQRITKFAGHTDNIRAILISENGDTILSASSDSTIKLWSLTAQRCITTFTMHSDSVWSLYSDHPQLTTFYGGSKDGLVTKTEINRYGSNNQGDDEDEDPGQCVVICKADEGIARLVAHDNARIWTATSSSSVYQWPDIPTRANRSVDLATSIAPANLLKMTLDEATFMDPTPDHYYPTSTVYSAASLGSLYINSSSYGGRDKQSQHSSEDDEGLIIPIFGEPENVIQGEYGLIKHSVLNNRRMVVTEDKNGEVALWDLIKCVQVQTFTGRKLDDVVNELNTTESVPTWCTIDTRIGALTIHLEEGRCFDAEVYVDEEEEVLDPERPEDQRIVIGKWVLKNLFDKYIPIHINAYEKECYRQQQLEEQAALHSVPTTVIINENNEVVNTVSNGNSATQDGRTPIVTPTVQLSSGRPTINTTPEGLRKSASESAPPTPSGALSSGGPGASSSTSAGTPPSSSGNGFMGRLKHSVKKLARTPSAEQRFENGRPTRKSIGSASAISIPSSSVHVSQPPCSPSIPEHTVSTSTETGTATTATSTASSPKNTTAEGPGSTSTLGVGATSTERLGQGACPTDPDDARSTSSGTSSSHTDDSVPSPEHHLPPSTVCVRAPHPPFSPPTNLDCPTTEVPPHIPVIISEQSREASSSVDLYRGSKGTLAEDYMTLVQIMPNWILEVLLKNTIPLKESAKVSFVLRPHHDQEGDRGPTRLGELPAGNPRLTAPRMLRARKVVMHVMDKLGLAPPEYIFEPQDGTGLSSTPGPEAALIATTADEPGARPLEQGETGDNSSVASESQDHQRLRQEQAEEVERLRLCSLRPESWLEILCNDQVMSPTMTLATIRAHYWKTGSDVVLTYRYRLKSQARQYLQQPMQPQQVLQ
ncbi:hypothetical protein BGW38_010379 [Lunasporangiospora selenospora]|uniref:WD40 repeat n=1 Tax=Lunasporangiospora selenospora TaxID=979761 RepID=A0A9P6FWR2_9FUNG|nr:hypothetical protein BGW38_010379 [Lunasporangiospora selenospora]